MFFLCGELYESLILSCFCVKKKIIYIHAIPTISLTSCIISLRFDFSMIGTRNILHFKEILIFKSMLFRNH